MEPLNYNVPEQILSFMNNEKKKSDSLPGDDIDREIERLDKLLSRGMDEVSDIEIDELTKGLSADEINLKIGDSKTAVVERSIYSQVKKIGRIVFEEGVQFIVEGGIIPVEQIPVESIEKLQTVDTDTKIGVLNTDGLSTEEITTLLKTFDEKYQQESGIIIRSDGTSFSFYARRPGKVVLIAERIFIVSADRDASCVVKISPDRMEATINCNPAIGSGRKLSLSAILATLEKAGVIRGIDKAAIENTVDNVNNSGLSLVNVLVARGQQPQNGKNSEITFHYPTEIPDIGFTILPDGRIDYKKQAPIMMVSNGDLLATVSEPESGVDGYDVTGDIIEAKSGEFDDILEGENVRRGETGDHFYAECNGVVSFHENILSVYPHYHVDGDVDMHCGNINFNGSVTVLGNVRSGFAIKANGDIMIAGSTEAAKIEAGRDVRINGAIVGGPDSYVKSGRNIFAGHVQNATLEAQGDIVIARSAMHSSIFSTGKVRMHDANGSIVGGTVNAMRGVEAMSIGSHIGTSTEIIVGSDYLVNRKLKEFQEIAKFNEANLQKIDSVLKPLLSLVKKGVPLIPEKKRRLQSIIDKRFNIIKQLRIVKRHRSKLSAIDSAAIIAEIIIKKTLYQDVTLKIADAIYRTNTDLRGVVCRLNETRDKIVQVPYSASRIKDSNTS